jgi:hypothetical protein
MAVVYPSGTLQPLPISEEFLRGLVFQSLNATRYTPITALIGFRDECAVSIGQFLYLAVPNRSEKRGRIVTYRKVRRSEQSRRGRTGLIDRR